MVQLGIWVWIPPLPPIFLLFNYFRENIWVRIALSLSLYFCSRTSWKDTQNCTSNNAFFVLFPFRPLKFWGRVVQIFQNSLRRYLSSRRLRKIFQIAFTQWVPLLTKNRFLVFFTPVKLVIQAIPVFFFLQKYPFFRQLTGKYYFYGQIHASAHMYKQKKEYLVKKWVKSSHLVFTIFSLSNWHYSSIV